MAETPTIRTMPAKRFSDMALLLLRFPGHSERHAYGAGKIVFQSFFMSTTVHGRDDLRGVAYGTNARNKYAAKSTRWTAPCITYVRPVLSVTALTRNVTASIAMSLGSKPRTSGR